MLRWARITTESQSSVRRIRRPSAEDPKPTGVVPPRHLGFACLFNDKGNFSGAAETAFNCINCSLATREVRPHVIGEVARGRTETGRGIEIEAKFGQDRQARLAAQHLEARSN